MHKIPSQLSQKFKSKLLFISIIFILFPHKTQFWLLSFNKVLSLSLLSSFWLFNFSFFMIIILWWRYFNLWFSLHSLHNDILHLSQKFEQLLPQWKHVISSLALFGNLVLNIDILCFGSSLWWSFPQFSHKLPLHWEQLYIKGVLFKFWEHLIHWK